MPNSFSIEQHAGRYRRSVRVPHKLPVLLAVIAFGTIDALAHEAEDIARLSIEELGNLEVTSVFKRPEAVGRSPTSVYVITQDEIRRSGAVSLPEVLRLAPNLEVARLDSSAYTVSARGFNTLQASNKLLVLVDGRSVYTPLHAGVYWDQYQVPLQEIERVEVISGPGGTLWGANAVNGVINIITRSAWDSDKGEAIVRGGSLDSSVAARYATSIGGTGAVRVYGSAFERGPMKRLDGSDADDDWRGVQGGFRSDWRFDDSDLTVQGDVFRNRFEVGDIEGINLLGRWTKHSSDTSRTELQVYADMVERDVNQVLDSLESIDAQFQQSFLVADRHHLVWGAGHRITRDKFDNDLNFFVLVPERDTVRLSHLFLQDSITTSASTTLTLGLKLEDSSFSGTEFLPSARLGWQVNDRNFWWAAVSRASRTPARLDRYLQAPGLLDPNPEFDSESLVAYETGYRLQPTSGSAISISLYYNDYDDLRMLVLNGNGRFQQANAVRGRTQGIEAWGDFQALPWWRVSVGLNALEKRLTLPPNAFLPVLYQHAGNDPKRQYWVRSSMDVGNHLDVDVSFRAVDDLPDPEVDSYLSLDARIAWQLSPSFTLAIVGSNLLDDAHPESGVLPGRLEVPRAGFLELDWRF
jgi:iron complex outermembrane recepter protein